MWRAAAGCWFRAPSPAASPVVAFTLTRVQTRVAARRGLSAVLSLQDLGVTKVGHMKRILCGIKELSRSTPAAEA